MGNLVLRRRAGEALVFLDADRAELGRLTVEALEGDRVKLVCAFAPHVAILRDELVGRPARPAVPAAVMTTTGDMGGQER